MRSQTPGVTFGCLSCPSCRSSVFGKAVPYRQLRRSLRGCAEQSDVQTPAESSSRQRKGLSCDVPFYTVGLSLVAATTPGASKAEQHSGVFALADIDAKTAGSIAAVLGPLLSVSILLMIFRIPLSWYPNINVKKFPVVVAYELTEPVLGPTRRAIPPVGGVDIAPIIWVAVLSFINEILLGPQGILNLLQRKLEL